MKNEDFLEIIKPSHMFFAASNHVNFFYSGKEVFNYFILCTRAKLLNFKLSDFKSEE